MQLRQPIRDLFLATWELESEPIKAQLPDGFEPITVRGRALVSVACFRNRPALLGMLPVPPYAEIDVRTFVSDRDGSSAVFVFDFFVPAVGLAAAPFGVPAQITRLKVSAGRVSAPGIHVAAAYAPGERAALGDRQTALSTHPAAYWLKNGRLRRMAGGYHGIVWREAALAGERNFGPVARLGADPRRPDYALYSDRAELKAALPARRVNDRA